VTTERINMPVYFNYDANANILYSQIYLQPLKFCNRDQKVIFYDMVKLITDCKQFVYFNIDENVEFKYVILLNTDVIGYIEYINSELIQCFILPEFRRNGIAMFANKLLFSIIPTQMYTVMLLSHNIAAITLYTNLGFQLTDNKKSINGIEYDIYTYADNFDKIEFAPVQVYPSTQLSSWVPTLEDNFPYRKYYIPSFSIMYNNLIEFYKTNCQANISAAATDISQANIISSATVNKYIAMVDRTFPEDYNNADSIVDHFVEHIRIHCAERNEKSPYCIWEENKDAFLAKENNVQN
jgi:hypothetical protein